MKKLLLILLLAVGASWLLAEPSESRDQEATRDAIARVERRPADRLVRLTGQDLPTPAPSTPAQPPRGRGRVRRGPTPPPPTPTPAPARPASKPLPAWFPKSEFEEEAKEQPDGSGVRVVVGQLSASEARARADLRKRLVREVADWLAADIPPSWAAPSAAIDRMILGSHVQAVTRTIAPAPAPGEADPGADASATPELAGLDQVYTLFRAGQRLDFSPSSRARFVEMYRRDVASWRMKKLGGGIGLALACLVVLSGYIKADEATKGYYTNRLRLLAAAGLGGAGVAAYQLLA